MRFDPPWFAIIVTGATVRPPISPIRIVPAIFALASFKAFSVKRAPLIAEFFQSMGCGAEGVRCDSQRVNEAAIYRPSRTPTPGGKSACCGNSHVKLNHI